MMINASELTPFAKIVESLTSVEVVFVLLSGPSALGRFV
jgi:hypothetical protein